MRRIVFVMALLAAAPLLAQTPAGAQRQTEQDEYTRYELLAPDTASFAIDYEVTATTPGAVYFFNPIRKGSVASDESVFDMMTGAPLKFEQVSGSEARASGLANADLGMDYLRIHLARPVPPDGGQARVRIVKTYKDPKSYFQDGDTIVFDRPLGIRRNSVVLPAGYMLTECNVPSQVLSEPDGRIRISFMHQAPGAAALVVKAKPGALIGPRRPAAAAHERAELGSAARRRDRPSARASPNARTRTATSSISCRSRPRTSSACTTTTPSRAKAWTTTSTSCARAARSRIRRRRSSIRARSSRTRS